jgi:electron transport complex protein RnfG
MKKTAEEVAKIVTSMVVTCAIGAAVLGGVFIATSRYRAAQEKAGEQRDVTELLALDASARLIEMRQFLAPAAREVIYRIEPAGGGTKAREVVFTLDGRLVEGAAGAAASSPAVTASAAAPATAEKLVPLGRTFVATKGGVPAGFVVEGRTNGYKNRIRFLVALRPDFQIAGVRVVEHEEDPGLGAEIATTEFESQFIDRVSAKSLGVTRDPMPEDWRAALGELRRMPVDAWRGRHRDLIEREREKPIYAVTGATISSRALADGVRATVERFRSRWERIAPYVEATP